MDRRLLPARNIVGGLRLPGDKSISHRYALLGAMAEGETAIRNYAPGADCASTLRCIESLGVGVSGRQAQASAEEAIEEVVIAGQGLGGFQPPAATLDAGNSGSTMRMLSGLLAVERKDVCRAFAPAVVVSEREEDGWACLVLRC